MEKNNLNTHSNNFLEFSRFYVNSPIHKGEIMKKIFFIVLVFISVSNSQNPLLYGQALFDIVSRYDNGTPKTIHHSQYVFDKIEYKNTMEYNEDGTLRYIYKISDFMNKTTSEKLIGEWILIKTDDVNRPFDELVFYNNGMVKLINYKSDNKNKKPNFDGWEINKINPSTLVIIEGEKTYDIEIDFIDYNTLVLTEFNNPITLERKGENMKKITKEIK